MHLHLKWFLSPSLLLQSSHSHVLKDLCRPAKSHSSETHFPKVGIRSQSAFKQLLCYEVFCHMTFLSLKGKKSPKIYTFCTTEVYFFFALFCKA